MAEVTDIDFEVEEKEVTRYECDQCKDVVEGDEINVEAIYDRRKVHNSGSPEEWRHVCDDCVRRERYGTLVDMWEKEVRLAEIVGYGVNKFGTVVSHAFSASVGASFSLLYVLSKFSPKVYQGTPPLTPGDWIFLLVMTPMIGFVVFLAASFIADITGVIDVSG